MSNDNTQAREVATRRTHRRENDRASGRGAAPLIVAAALLALPGTDARAGLLDDGAPSGTYRVFDSRGPGPTAPGGPRDVSGGTGSGFPGDDTAVAVTAPFPLSILGSAATDAVLVHDNGFLALGPQVPTPANGALPSPLLTAPVAAPMWDDLVPIADSQVTWATLGDAPERVFVVQWTDMAHAADLAARYTFQAQFFEARPAEVAFAYVNLTGVDAALAGGSSATIGAQNGARVALAFVDAPGALADGLVIDIDRDSDRDGLTDAVEDRDRDGIVDAGETDPALFDSDDGGAGDGAERLIDGTDPVVPGDDVTNDADGDGLTDSDEAVLGSDPDAADGDGDGLTDPMELLILGTDPRARDTDGDLLGDGDEVAVDGDPSSFGDGDSDPRSRDSDGGGEDDGSELASGRDPRDPADDRPGPFGPLMSTGVIGADATRVMAAAVDDGGNVHVASENRTGVIHYAMLGPDGATRIAWTVLAGVGGTPRYPQLAVLADGRVALVWAQGRSGTGGIGYRLLDPSLDDQDGDAADGDLNPSSPPTAGDGISVRQGLAVANQHGGALDGYTHLSMARDAADRLHLVFQTAKAGNRTTRRVLYARLKGTTGALEVPVTTIAEHVKPDGAGTKANPARTPVHARSIDRVFTDADGAAHILFAAFDRRPRFGGDAALAYARVGPDGAVVVPLTPVVAGVAGHFGWQAGVATEDRVTLLHTGEVTVDPVASLRRRSLIATQRRFNLAPVPRAGGIVDSPALGASGSMFGAVAAAAPEGGMAVVYGDRFASGRVRLAVLAADGRLVAGPAEMSASQVIAPSPRRLPKTALAVSPDGTRMVAAWFRRTTGRIEARAVDTGDVRIGLAAVASVTVAAGGVLVAAAPLAGARAVFGPADTTADTYAVLQRSRRSLLDLPGPAVGLPARVDFRTGGAQLAPGAGYQIALPVPADFGGDPAVLAIMQHDGTGWTQLPSTLDDTQAPPTVTATATALGDLVLADPDPTVTFTSTPPTSAVVGAALSYTAEVMSSAPASFALDSGPPGMSIDAATGALAWTPGPADLGSHAVVLRASSAGASATQSFVLIVTLTGNTPPRLVSSPPLTAEVGAPYAYTPEILDPDGPSASFNLFTAPVAMTIDSGTGEVRWTPSADQVGVVPVSIGVTDGIDTAVQSFAVVVAGEEAAGGNAPVFVSSPPLRVRHQQSYRYTASAVDADGDALRYALVTAPAGMTIDADTGEVAWTPGAGDVGAVPVSITVTDGVSTVAQIFSVEVMGPDDFGVEGGGCCGAGGGPLGGVAAVLVGAAVLRRRRS